MPIAFITGGSGFVGRNLIQGLKAHGYDVRSLARSPRSERIVQEHGATPVHGDLSDPAALRQGMAGCDLVVHAAAHVEEWGPRDVFYEINVRGTENVLEAARTARVPRLVHISSESVLVGGPRLVHADETWPYPHHFAGLYAETKAIAEQRVREADGLGITTVVVRPRLIWGRGDTSVLPRLVDYVKTGRWMWIDGGRYLTSTTHVANVVEGVRLAAERGRGGAIYFVTDGEPIEFRAFLTRVFETQGVDPGKKSVPHGVALAAGALAETTWKLLRLRGAPPATRYGVRVAGEEVTVDDGKARTELGYKEVITREQGLAEMATSAQSR